MGRIATATAAALLLAVAALAPARAQMAWQEYRPTDGGFRVELPGPPDVTTIDTPARVVIAIVYEDTAEFRVQYRDYSDDVASDPRAQLDVEIGGPSLDRVHLDERLTIDGAPARRLVANLSDETVLVDLAVFRGNRMIHITSFVPAGEENSPTVQRIYRSFALLER